ncbi:MAG: isoprenylcysteine carboxylmethyltransferase family protein [Planctomycetota bacterium]|mgnify:CR=1 FL=1|jgi:protein-S-isoprenylcysteine O-methyltransferase Ste14|nr:isoprenylcysteine carboxylmethyltransferase family protein [Planctomycetota bacterium]
MQRRGLDNLAVLSDLPQALMDYADHPRASKKLTPRKLFTYVASLLLISLADPNPATFAIGCVLVALAWLLRVWSFGHLEKNCTMVTTGPYAHTRNPAYLGSFLALIGVALAAGNPDTTSGQSAWGFGIFLVIVFFAVYLPRKFRKEYPRLQKLFGEELEQHAKNVPDFFPRLRAWRSGDDRKFSWARVSANHEWSWGFVLTFVMALIFFVDCWSPLHP